MEKVDGLPDVPGLSDFVKAQDKDQPQDPPKPPQEDKVEELSDYDRQMLERLKNPKDVLKHLKDIQAFTTKLSQDKKTLEAQLAQVQQEKEDLEFGQPAPTPAATYQPPQQEYESQDEYITRMVGERVATERVKEVIEEEYEKNATEFPSRWGMVQMLARKYPTKSNSARGVRELFKKADEEMAKQYKSAALRALEDLPDDLPPEQAEKVKAKLRKYMGEEKPQPSPSGVYMPETTGATRTEPRPANFDDEIAKATAEGNADKVAELTFKKVLNA